MALVAVLAYINTLPNELVFDTRNAVYEKAPEQLLAEPARLLQMRRPLVSLSLGFNASLNRSLALPPDHVTGYHLFNLLVHVAAGMVLYGLLRRLFRYTRRPRGDNERIAPWLAGAIALLWVVHPLNTQAVSYVVQRGESMMGMFMLLSLYALVRHTEAPDQRGWAATCVVAGWASMASKEVGAVIPLVALVLDRTLLAGSWKVALQERWRVYVGLAVPWLTLPWILPRVLDGSGGVGLGLAGLSPIAYLLSQGQVILHYLRLSFWPHPLIIDYAWPASYPDGTWLPGVIIVGALLAVTAWGVWRKAWWSVPAAAFFLVLGPTSSFIPIADLAVEHRMYVPLIAVVTLVVLLAFAGLRRLITQRSMQATIGGAVVAGLALSLATGTVVRNLEYRYAITLWESTVANVPQNPRAEQKLGEARQRLAGELSRHGMQDRAVEQLELAVKHYGQAVDKHQRFAQQGRRLQGSWHLAHANLGNVLRDLANYHQRRDRDDLAANQLAEAERHLRLAVEVAPEDARSHYDLGRVLMARRETADAAEALATAIALKPRFAEAYHALALVRLNAGESDEAVRLLRQAVRLKPNLGRAQAALGELLLQRDDVDEAISALEAARRLTRFDSSLFLNLAIAHMRRRDLHEAAHLLWRVTEEEPYHLRAHVLLGQVSERLGDAWQARRAYENALELDPNQPDAAIRLALLLTTHPEDEFRDADRAAMLLEPYRDTEEPSARLLEALAALHAERNEMDQAVRAQQRAIALATDADAHERRIERMRERLETYEAGEPYRHAAYVDEYGPERSWRWR